MGQAAEWAREPDQTADVSNVTIYGMMIACDHRRHFTNVTRAPVTVSHVSDERAPRSQEPGLLAYAVASADGATVLEAREGSSDVCLILLGNDHPARERGGNERQAGVGGEEDVCLREVVKV